MDKQYLLASINNLGQLHYQVWTNGVMAGSSRTGLGCTNVMQVNPYNGFVALGHSLGTVSMWKPTTFVPLLSYKHFGLQSEGSSCLCRWFTCSNPERFVADSEL